MRNKVPARELRKNMADAERALWKHIRLKQMHGLKFRRQCPIGKYIVDFVCYERKLIIELDGGQHADQTSYELQRTKWLQDEGFRVMRFWNDDVLKETDAVIEELDQTLTPHLSPPPFATKRWRNQSQNAFPPKDGSVRFSAEWTNLAAFCLRSGTASLCGGQGGRRSV